MTVLFAIGLLLLVLGFSARLADALLRPREKERIHTAMASFSTYLHSTDATFVIKAPLRLTTKLVDRLFGKRCLSVPRLFRSLLFGACLFSFSMTLSALHTGTLPFPLDDFPWQSFDRAFDAIRRSPDQLSKTGKQSPKEREQIAKAVQEVEKLNNPVNHWIYSLLYFPFLIVSATLIMSGSLSFARKMLAEMAAARNLFLLLALGGLCLILLPLLYLFAFGLLYTIASPIVWLYCVELANFGHAFSIAVSVVMSMVMIIFGFFTANTWLRVLVSTVVLPVTAMAFIWPFAVLLFFVRKPLHWIMVQFIERALSSKLGFFLGCAAVFIGLGFLVIAIARVLNGQVPW